MGLALVCHEGTRSRTQEESDLVDIVHGNRHTNRLVIRADGGPAIGSGHLMRCLALAQAWQADGGRSTFLMASSLPMAEARLIAEGMQVSHLACSLGSPEDAVETSRLAREWKAEWVVVDGYHFSGEYQQIVKESEMRLLCVDDYGHSERYCADIVLNQNLHANESLYAQRKPFTRLLLGTKYVLLRREFLRWRSWKRETPDVVRRVLITLGGMNADETILKILRAFRGLDLQELVAVGMRSTEQDRLRSTLFDLRGAIRTQTSIADMAELMAEADMAVSGGGSTCWELAFMGLPTIILVLAANQEPVARSLDAEGAALDLGWINTVTEEALASAVTRLTRDSPERKRMSERARQLADGEGAARVVAAMKEYLR